VVQIGQNGSPARSCVGHSDKLSAGATSLNNVMALTDAAAVKVDDRPVLKQLFDNLHDDRLLPLYAVAVHTGLRQGELLALRWSDVDLAAGTATVTGTFDLKIRQRTDPKTDKSRRNVPLARRPWRLSRFTGSARTSKGHRATKIWSSRVRGHGVVRLEHPQALAQVSANLGLSSMPWHNLRHSAATIMLAQGVPIEVVSRVFGHASIRITADIYGHVSPETNKQAADAMARALR